MRRGTPTFNRIPKLAARIALLFTALTLCACAAGRTAREEQHIQWPPLPLPARIVWVKEISDYQDAGIAKGFWKRLKDLVAGESDEKIGRPYGLLVDDRERLFVVDVALAVVHVMDMREKKYTIIGEGKEAVFRTPIAIAADDDENVYITDSEAGIVYRYSLRDAILKPFITNLGRPTGIGFNRNNRLLYVADTTAHQVVVYDLSGKVRFRIGNRGEGPGQFNHPTDLFIGQGGKLYVTDPLNARIQVFSADGAFLQQFGRPGDSPGEFMKPKGVAVDSDGNIYVSDALLEAVQVFSGSGRFLLDFGGRGIKAGEFWMQSGMCIDRNDQIYVADSYNRRVQVFRYIRNGGSATEKERAK